jgi:hypothetical protein
MGDHDEAVLRAEIRRLVRALGPFGVLRRDVLAHEVRAESWQQAGFDRALEAAVRAGEIEQLPVGFYGLPRPPSTQLSEDQAE